MSYTILEIAHPARLSIRHNQLVVEREGLLPFHTPAVDLNTLLLAHPQITLSQAVLSRLAAQGAAIVTIDGQYLPSAMVLPLQSHTLQSERLSRQAALSTVLRKRLWTCIVRAKITAQGRLLRELNGTDSGLLAMAQRVRSGDPDNLEAQAARRYWPLVFANARFRRGADMALDGADQNQHLDYGYIALRAMVARAITAAGLHPSLGLRHHNRYDNFCLAADLMEPFRPIIDRRVALWIRDHNPAQKLDSAAKKFLIEAVTMRYWLNREERSLSDILGRVAVSLAEAMTGDDKLFELPQGLEPCPDVSTSPATEPCG